MTRLLSFVWVWERIETGILLYFAPKLRAFVDGLLPNIKWEMANNWLLQLFLPPFPPFNGSDNLFNEALFYTIQLETFYWIDSFFTNHFQCIVDWDWCWKWKKKLSSDSNRLVWRSVGLIVFVLVFDETTGWQQEKIQSNPIRFDDEWMKWTFQKMCLY